MGLYRNVATSKVLSAGEEGGGMDIKWNQWYHRLCAQTVNIDREINSNRVLNEISTFAFYSMQVKQHSLFNWYSTIIKLLNFQPVWQVVYKTMH